jgi:sterol desaturase/sphingolipid hydroxylase (fatty acid hydroxylase superfamily)
MSVNLNDFIMTNEMPIRLGFFFGVFGVMALWEMISPRRHLRTYKAIRWANNLGLVFFNSFILRLVFPAAAVGMAVFASEQGWGLLNYIAAPFLVAVLAAVVIMDFFIWLQHVMVHAVPVLWRLHRVQGMRP